MPSQRTHIEPSACVCILALLKRIVAVWGSLLN